MDEFPPNRKTRDSEPPEDKKVEQIVTEGASRRKKGLGRQFAETFITGDAKMAARYVIFDVLIPAAKDTLADAGSQGLEKLIFGEARTPRRRGPGKSGPYGTGYVSYNRLSQPPTPQDRQPTRLSRRARASHEFDEIVLTSRTEAERVIDRLFDIVGRYQAASVADLYAMVGLESTHTDHKWGWTDMQGAGVTRLRNQGFLLDLPDPEPLD